MICNGTVCAAISEPTIPLSANDGTLNTYRVELEPQSGCGACTGTSGCGVRLLPTNPQKMTLVCHNASGVPLAAGDHVQVEVSEPDFAWLMLVARAYGLPTLGMLLGAMVGEFAARALPATGFSAGLPALGFVAGLTGGLFAWNRFATTSVSLSSLSESFLTDNGGITQSGRIVGIALAGSATNTSGEFL